MVSAGAVKDAVNRVAELPSVVRRFKAYPAYRESGVEWLGGIPAHWEMSRRKRLAAIVSGLAPPKSYERSAGEYPVYGSNGLIGYCGDYFIGEETLAVGRVSAPAGRLTWYQPGVGCLIMRCFFESSNRLLAYPGSAMFSRQ
jgi:hypothetical protein